MKKYRYIGVMKMVDFNTFTELDPNTHIAILSSSMITHEAYRNEDAWLYKDYGANYFDTDLTHYLEVTPDGFTVVGILASGTCWALTNDVEDLNDLTVPFLSLSWYNHGANPKLELKEHSAPPTQQYDQSIALVLGTRYYLTIVRDATTLKCYIYSNAKRSTLVDTLTITLEHPTVKYRYFFAALTYNIASADHFDYTLRSATWGFSIGGWVNTDCGRILDIDIEEMVDFASNGILGKDTPTINPDNYMTTPKKWTIVMRMTLAKRITLKAQKDKHETLLFVLQAGETDYVKFEEMHYRWAGDEDKNCPWLVTVTLKSVLY